MPAMADREVRPTESVKGREIEGTDCDRGERRWLHFGGNKYCGILLDFFLMYSMSLPIQDYNGNTESHYSVLHVY